MTAPFDPDDLDPEETHGSSGPGEDPFDLNSLTWGTADPDFDDMFRERLGPLPTMPTPPYAFERVLVTGRRRRARKVWAGAAAAAFVVMAGTAGTTVALHGSSPNGGVVGAAGAGTTSAATSAAASPTPSPLAPLSAAASPTMTSTPSLAPTGTASATAGASAPQCASDTFKLSVSTVAGSTGSTADELLIVLTNTSSHACTTYGYPGLELETQGGQLQSTTVTRVNKSSVQHLTVGAGESISTTASYTAAAPGSTTGAGCGAPSYYLALIPPNEQIQIVQTISGGPITVCGSGVLNTNPLVMGSSG